ncbi:MAG: DUF6280 family protein [Sulfitobacter sp.]
MTREITHCTTKPYQRLFASVVLAVIDDAIVDENHGGDGVDIIARWARSQDGQTVLRCAGIDPSQRCIDGLKRFVQQGIKPSAALSSV